MATPKKTTTSKKPTTSKAKTTKTKSRASKPKVSVDENPFSSPPIKKAGFSGLLGWLVAVLLGGGLLGTLMADSFWMEQFDDDAGMLVIDDKTWMPVGGSPITVVVLNDENCGAPCDTTASLDSLRASVNPAMIVEEVDVSSEAGQLFIETFDLVSVPQFFFGEDIEDLEADGPDGEEIKFVDNLPPGLLTKREDFFNGEDLYYIDGAQVGFKLGKFIKPPEFANLDTEPTKGTGPVKVIEFTNYQCSFCKKLHDENSALINQLVADNKITYIVKDYPMFQANDRFAHRAANCVLEQGGNEAYWEMNNALFEAQAAWSRIAEPEVYMNDLALNVGYDVSSCMASGEIESEIMADMTEGSRYGVTGTPALFIGTQFMPGAISPATFNTAVEAELNS